MQRPTTAKCVRYLSLMQRISLLRSRYRSGAPIRTRCVSEGIFEDSECAVDLGVRRGHWRYEAKHVQHGTGPAQLKYQAKLHGPLLDQLCLRVSRGFVDCPAANRRARSRRCRRSTPSAMCASAMLEFIGEDGGPAPQLEQALRNIEIRSTSVYWPNPWVHTIA